MRIAVFGGEGQVGAALIDALVGHEVVAPPHTAVDVRERSAVSHLLEPLRPDWVVTAVAYHDVDRCEEELPLALEVNALGAWNVAAEAARLGARVLYVSTDYVFAGSAGRPYGEDDATAPVNAYGASKVAGEAMTQAANPQALVVRTAAVFGRHPCRGKRGRNFVELMLDLATRRDRVRVVDDETVSPTYADHLAAQLRAAIEADAAGVLHAAGGGATTWHGLACAVFEEAGLPTIVDRAAADEFPKKAARPRCSALVSVRGERLGLPPMPAWRDGLRAYLQVLQGGG